MGASKGALLDDYCVAAADIGSCFFPTSFVSGGLQSASSARAICHLFVRAVFCVWMWTLI